MSFLDQLISKFKQLPDTNPDLDREIAGRQERMRERMEAIKQEMGEKYIMHPSHKKGRLDAPRPV